MEERLDGRGVGVARDGREDPGTARGNGAGSHLSGGAHASGAPAEGAPSCAAGPTRDPRGGADAPGEAVADYELRTCPRCGAQLFADMDVCYGCLYDFGREGAAGRSPARERLDEQMRGHLDAPPLDDQEIWGSLDEIWDDAPVVSVPANDVSFPACGSPRHGCCLGSAGVESRPRAGEPDMPCATAAHDGKPSLRSCGCHTDSQGTMELEALGEGAEGAWVRVCLNGASFSCPIPASGLLVGRGEDSHVRLDSRAVSRCHLRIVAEGDGASVQDLGATNPALLNGRPLGGSVRMGASDVLELRGTDVRIRICAPRG